MNFADLLSSEIFMTDISIIGGPDGATDLQLMDCHNMTIDHRTIRLALI